MSCNDCLTPKNDFCYQLSRANRYSFLWPVAALQIHTIGQAFSIRQATEESPKMFNYKKNRAWTEGLHIVMQIGLTMAGCIVFCFFVGLYLDKWLGTKGIFIAIFTVLGIIGGG